MTFRPICWFHRFRYWALHGVSYHVCVRCNRLEVVR